ncbi:MAG: AbrB/MazE/SpoVT family DNA-binding domain-containing protein [Clostridia bacterium]|nr:AbrB/MazE/SpoVT family DNA-binding domain-containing protein [Clostridia bacterium]
MSCGMVRKVDELGRVVIPKEMRRILNIKTGSSIEMIINDENEVVLKKFSEMNNISKFAEVVADILFEEFNVPCLVCDEDKVIFSKGVSKKDFLNKKIPSKNDEWFVCPVHFGGFQGGSIMLQKKDGKLDDDFEKTVYIFSKFLGNILSE